MGKIHPSVSFDVEQIAEPGKIKDLTHRLIEVSDDHVALAVHSLCRTEQNAQSGAGDVVQASEVLYQLTCVAYRFIDLSFEGGRGDGVKSSFKQ